MSRKESFGMLLRMARQDRRISVTQAADKLRVRPDIIRAIENEDYERMPPKGYAKNMVGAYAKLVGVNPDKVVKLYQEFIYQEEISSQHKMGMTPAQKSRATSGNVYSISPKASRIQSNPGYRQSKASMPVQPGRERVSLYEERYNALERDRQRNEAEYMQRSGRGSSSAVTRRPHRTQHSSLTKGTYGNMVQEPMRAPKASKVPLIIGILIVVLLVFGAVKLLSPKETTQSTKSSDSSVSISGLTDPEKSGTSTTTESVKVTPIAPTAAVFSYEVPDGESAYIEIYIDDATELAETVEGPSHDTYDVTGTLKFVTSRPDSVKLTLAGKTVTPTEDGSTGVYIYTVDFDEYLEEWKAANLSE